MLTWGKGLATLGIMILAIAIIFGAWNASHPQIAPLKKTDDILYLLAVIQPKWESFAAAAVPNFPQNYISLIFVAADIRGNQRMILISLPISTIADPEVDFSLVYAYEVKLVNVTIPKFQYIGKVTQHMYTYSGDCWREAPYSAYPDAAYTCVELPTVK